MTDWHPEPDQLVELALAEATLADEERVLAHLSSCATCRDEYTALFDGVQRALVAAPAVAPPAGFSGRVLEGIRPSTGAEGRPGGHLRHRWPRLAVAAALGLVVGIGGTLGVAAWLSRPPASSTQLQPVANVLVTSAGRTVGSVGLATQSGRRYVVVNITTGRPGVRYECILVGQDGARTSGGAWTLTDESYPGSASGSWLVPFAGDPPAGVELVTPAGTVWARAEF